MLTPDQIDSVAREWADGSPAALRWNYVGDPIMGWTISVERFRHAARAIEALVRAKCVPQWRDIASAPKDGTAVLGLLDGSDVAHAVRWLPASDKFASGVAGWHIVWDLTPVALYDGPTHWMPLPAAPTITAPQVDASSALVGL